ncbi:MAG: hypothetical protein ACYDCO_06140 [Armatimonadota bacterium]
MKSLFIIRIMLPLILLFAGMAACAQATDPAAKPAPEPFQARFDRSFAAWQNWVAGQPDRALLTIGEEFREMVDLGPRAAPLLAEQMLAAATPREGAALAEALARVTDKRIPRAQWPEGKYLDPVVRLDLYTRWWKDGRGQTSAEFDRLYARWKELKAQGLVFVRDVYVVTYDDETKTVVPKRDLQRTELADVYDALENMGIDILPLIVEQFAAKDYDLLPIFRELTHIVPRGRNLDEKVAYCVKWWEANKGEWLISMNAK